MAGIDTAAIEERVRGDLDLAYVVATGVAVATALVEGAPIEANYQPGDGTRYGLIFVPLWRVVTAPPRVAPIRANGHDRPVVWDRHAFSGGAYEFGWTYVGRDGGPGQAISLRNGQSWHPTYVEGRWVSGYASAVAVSMLLDAVSEAMPR